jgi:hypothetical protein
MEQFRKFSSETPKSKEEIEQKKNEIEQKKQFLLNLDLIFFVYGKILIPKDDIGSIIDAMKDYLKEKEPAMGDIILEELIGMLKGNLEKIITGEYVSALDILREILRCREKTWSGSIFYMFRKFLEISKEYLTGQNEQYKKTVGEILNVLELEEANISRLEESEFFKVFRDLFAGWSGDQMDYIIGFKSSIQTKLKELNEELANLNKELEKF